MEKLVSDFCDTFSEAIKPVLKTITDIVESLCSAFSEAWKSAKCNFDFLNTKLTRKRFFKLLMSIGYQRNEANKIVFKYHSEKGHYTLRDFLVEKNNKEDKKWYG